MATVEDAVAAIPAEARRVFLTVGGRALAPFATRPKIWFLVRLVDEPPKPIPLARHRLICARGPSRRMTSARFSARTASIAW